MNDLFLPSEREVAWINLHRGNHCLLAL